MNNINILLVEDDIEINRLVQKYLAKENYNVDPVFDGQQALEQFRTREYHLVILDLMIPRVDGYEVLRRIRERNHLPVLILSAKTEEMDKVLGLGLGADDYLTKPFNKGELMARVKAQLRRYLYFKNKSKNNNDEDNKVLRYKGLSLNLSTYQVQRGEDVLELTPKEFELLKLFLSNPGQVFSKSQIFNQVWDDNYYSDDNTVMVHIRRLRKKIEVDPSDPTYIQTVWGIGYKLGGE